jgi:uncharacterized protein (UPF0303 family)
MKIETNYTDKFSLGIVIGRNEISIAIVFIIIDIKLWQI